MCYTEPMKLTSFAKRIGISYNTAWRMWKRGQRAFLLVAHRNIVEPPEQRVTPPQTVAVYARVSTSENKKNLETHTQRLISWCNAASAGQLPKSSKSVAVGSMISAPSSWLCSQTPNQPNRGRTHRLGFTLCPALWAHASQTQNGASPGCLAAEWIRKQ